MAPSIPAFPPTLIAGSPSTRRQGVQDQGTSKAGGLSLAFQKNLGSKSLALKVEHRVKSMSKAKKEQLISASGYAEQIVDQAKKR